MTTTIIIIAIASAWVLFSAAIVVIICMNASRLSQAEELPRDRRPRRSSRRRGLQVENPSPSIPAGSSVAKSSGH